MIPSRPSFTRFVLPNRHPDTGVQEGVFTTAYELRDGDDTPEHDREVLTNILSWFDDNMSVPTRFNRTKSKGYQWRNTKGISWLRADAVLHITKFLELSVVLAEHGHVVEQLHTQRPGYVVYEDQFQIVAEPFADT